MQKNALKKWREDILRREVRVSGEAAGGCRRLVVYNLSVLRGQIRVGSRLSASRLFRVTHIYFEVLLHLAQNPIFEKICTRHSVDIPSDK